MIWIIFYTAFSHEIFNVEFLLIYIYFGFGGLYVRRAWESQLVGSGDHMACRGLNQGQPQVQG